MRPCQLTTLINTTANSIAYQIDDDELALLATSFTQLGDTLSTILVQRGICKEQKTH